VQKKKSVLFGWVGLRRRREPPYLDVAIEVDFENERDSTLVSANETSATATPPSSTGTMSPEVNNGKREGRQSLWQCAQDSDACARREVQDSRDGG